MLPNPLHPAVVHFPIVLAVLAPLVAAGALWAIRRGVPSRRAWSVPALLLGALVLSGWVAAQTGEREEDRVERVVSERPIHAHEEAAELFVYATAGVLAIALVGLLPGAAGRAGRALGTVGTVALVVVGWNVGHTGGELVYRYGAAQAYSAPRAGGADVVRASRDEDRDH